MNDDDDIDGLAAEYVLGSLDPAERRETEIRSRADLALRKAIYAWEVRLGDLNERVPGIAPPPHLFACIAGRLWGPEAKTIDFAEAKSARRGPRSRRVFAAGASLLAACLALVAVWLFQVDSSNPNTLIAVLQRSTAAVTADENASSKGQPAFEAKVDLKAQTIVITPVAARPTGTRRYQLWLIRRDDAAPHSLGVVSQSGPSIVSWNARHVSGDFLGATLAVSVEPAGGPETVTPSGPFVFVGKLVPPTP